MAFLILDRLTFTMGDWSLCASLRVGRGQCAALIGASGAGKSTLLSLIAGFETPDSGMILVDNQDIGSLAPVWHFRIQELPKLRVHSFREP